MVLIARFVSDLSVSIFSLIAFLVVFSSAAAAVIIASDSSSSASRKATSVASSFLSAADSPAVILSFVSDIAFSRSNTLWSSLVFVLATSDDSSADTATISAVS